MKMIKKKKIIQKIFQKNKYYKTKDEQVIIIKLFKKSLKKFKIIKLNIRYYNL